MRNRKSKFPNPKLQINPAGELVAETELGAVKFTKPVAYQEIDGKRVEVACEYAIAEGGTNLEFGFWNLDWFSCSEINNFRFPKSALQNPNSVINNTQHLNSKLIYGFKVAAYDTTKDLIIDPLLASTFLGGESGDYASSVAIDKSGNIYVAGVSYSGDFPTTDGVYDNSHNGGNEDVFVSKFNSDLSQLLASTFLGGSVVNSEAGDDYCSSILVDKDGNIFVSGCTGSQNFPTTTGAYDTSYKLNAWGWSRNTHNGFISKLNGDLTQLLASTFFGGGGMDGISISSMTIDSHGNICIAGGTDYNVPVTDGAYRTSYNGRWDGFISKLSGDLTALLASTYFGSSGTNDIHAITLDSEGNAYITGYTESSDLPTTDGAYDTTFNGTNNTTYAWIADAFVSKLNSSLTELLASTYLGGSNSELASSIAIDRGGNVYVAGTTQSSDFPVTAGAYDTSYNGTTSQSIAGDVFVSKFSGDLKTLLASTYLGGTLDEDGAVAIDAMGNIYVIGSTNSADFPITPDVFQMSIGGVHKDGFVSKLNRNLAALLSSTYLGGSSPDWVAGIATKSTGDIYVVGQTQSINFPTIINSYDTTYNGNSQHWVTKEGRWGGFGDAFVSKFFLPNSYCNSDYLSISKITPETGGDTGSVTMTIHGCQFQEGATVRLTRTDQPDIEADPVTVSDGGESISATLNLRGKELGIWNVVVTNPDDSSVVQKNAFTIEEGQEPKIWVDIIGRNTMRRNTWTTFYIVCGNSGDVDAIGVPAAVWGIPGDAEVECDFAFESTTLSGDLDGDGVNDVEVELPDVIDVFDEDEDEEVEANGEMHMPFIIPKVPAKSSVTYKYRIKNASSFSGSFQLKVAAAKPVFSSKTAEMTEGNFLDLIECFGLIAKLIFGVVPGTECILNAGDMLGRAIISNMFPEVTKAVSFEEFSKIGIGCVLEILEKNKKVAGFFNKLVKVREKWTQSKMKVRVLGKVTEAKYLKRVKTKRLKMPKLSEEELTDLKDFLQLVFTVEEYEKIKEPCDKGFSSIGSGELAVKDVVAVDPNIKTGSQGVSEQKYVSGSEPLKYIIYCENVGTATAAAAEVTITDWLGTDTVDLNTFSLGDITFGSSTVTPVAGLSEFSTKVDLRPNKNLVVRIDAGLDKDSGLVLWHLVAIDPDTNDYPQDTMLGVLPPNVTPPEGDGSVVFTIMPKAGLPTGTEVRNKASIVFDVNAAMVTNEWLNTIDNDKPSSHVLPLAARQMNLSFPVYWDGTDVGAGVRDYTVYVSANGGAYTPWITNGTDTASLFTGAPGMRYAFYSTATDNAGNLEDAPRDADTVTKINIPPVANAGDDQQVYVNGLATLNGGGSSDTDGDALSYHWVFQARPSGSAAAFSDETSKTPTFTPDKAGTYTIGLTVNDGAADSTPDTVIITTINRPPVADAGLDQTIHAGRTATLDGSSSSDPDGDAITYLWAFASIPAGSAATLSNTSAVKPTFVTDKVGAYTVSLVVNDGVVNSPSDTVTVNAGNTAPTANAGSDQTAGVGDTVTLNGSGSSDADGDPITYSWSLTSRPSGSAASLSKANTVSPTFVVDIAGAYEASLMVNDGFVNSAPDAVAVTAHAPMADGLQALYPFNEGSGTAAHDASGNGRDGVVHGATWTAGKESGGLNFNGKNHYVSIPTVNNDELSLCAWFNKGAKDTKDKDVILGGYQLKTRHVQNGGFALSFDPSAPDTLEFTLVTQNSKGKRTQKIAGAKIHGSVGSWHHVAGVYDKETGKQMLYVDGKLVSTATHPANNVVSPLTRYTVMNIGCSLDSKGYYKGVIDDVRLYNRALSEQEIYAIIQEPLGPGFLSR